MTNSAQPDSSIVPAQEEPGAQMTFFEHLVELRKRIINSLASILIGAMIGWFVAPHFVNVMVQPMVGALKSAHLNPQLVYSHPAGYLNLLITVSIYLGIVIASPWVLYQIWLFVAPALYKHERSAITGFLFSTVFLFLAGIAFGYFVSLPYVLKFLISFQGPVVPLINIDEYFSLILLVLLGLGLVFELPILIFFLSLFGIVTPQFLIRNFRYALLVIAILAAVLTPTPDATTMVLFMLVLMALYFLGVGVSWMVVRKRKRRLAEEAEAH
ncbi:MAG: twin-arginine translocase subunit TatC [Candidatus Acidiferrum sp.]